MGATGSGVAADTEDGPTSEGSAAVFGGIWWRARTGSSWRDLPERYGPWETAYAVFRRWQIDETRVRVLKKLPVKADTDGIIEWEVLVDSTVCRAHQHAAGARREGLTIRAGRVRTASRRPRGSRAPVRLVRLLEPHLVCGEFLASARLRVAEGRVHAVLVVVLAVVHDLDHGSSRWAKSCSTPVHRPSSRRRPSRAEDTIVEAGVTGVRRRRVHRTGRRRRVRPLRADPSAGK
ncbi:transposase [Streptomyces sp. Wh19]|uniref:Transposase n=1 Tax=Streptomyces sanglieri TaxID=193460 RepID=A0ABW2X7E2_9ACTN